MASCALCNDQEKRDEDDTRLGFDFTPDELLRSASEGNCVSCLVILEGLRQYDALEPYSFEKDVRRVYVRCCGQRGNLNDTLSAEMYFVDERPKLELEFYSLQPRAWKSMLPRTPVSGHPLSEKALVWIGSRIDTCMRNHTLCKDNLEAFLPKRVLSFQTESDGSISVRLVEPADRSQGVYAALSHCWGEARHCITTEQTLEERKNGIPWDTMADSFQSAIKLLTKLGIGYIWIDSLCIIQDNLNDWEIESAKMAEIYSHAWLTIANTMFPDDPFNSYLQPSVLKKDLSVGLPGLEACQIGVRQPIKHWNDIRTNERSSLFPLQSRGWAFQERLLSQRTLHICRSELVWECQEIGICECGGFEEQVTPAGEYNRMIKLSEDNQSEGTENRTGTEYTLLDYVRPGEDGFDRYSEFVSRDDLGQDKEVPPGAVDVTSLREGNAYVFSFHQTIEQYSALQLTKRSDRLPALSGLCKRMQPFRGQYVAGLWMDSIHFDLLWRVETLSSDTDPYAGTGEYHGPSWSWTAVSHPVRYWPDIFNFLDAMREPAELERNGIFFQNPYWVGIIPSQATCLGRSTDKIDLDLKVSGQNPLGSVERAVLTVEASSITALLKYTYDSYWHDRTNRINFSRYSLSFDTKDPLTEDKIQIEVPFFADYPLGVIGQRHVPENTTLSLLLVHPTVALVLLQDLEDIGSTSTWKRIGIVRISHQLVRMYLMDWMGFSSVKKFRIV